MAFLEIGGKELAALFESEGRLTRAIPGYLSVPVGLDVKLLFLNVMEGLSENYCLPFVKQKT